VEKRHSLVPIPVILASKLEEGPIPSCKIRAEFDAFSQRGALVGNLYLFPLNVWVSFGNILKKKRHISGRETVTRFVSSKYTMCVFFLCLNLCHACTLTYN